MLRYGKNNIITNKKSLKRRIYSYNLLVKRAAFLVKKRIRLTKLKTLYYVPTYWSKVILNNPSKKDLLIIYLFSDVYFFKIVLTKPFLKWSLDLNTNLIVTRNYFEPFFKGFFLNTFRQLFRSFSYWFYTKLKIKGKGYYVYKTYRNTLTHQLGHSHRRYIYSYFVFMKFLSKTTIYIAGFSKNDLLKAGRLLQESKYINIFTGRGVRFTKQIIYKKTGKVSTYR